MYQSYATGQVAGLSSTEFGLANMIWAAVVVGKDGDFVITQVRVHYERDLLVMVKFIMLQGKTVGLFAGLLVLHGILVRP